MVVPVVDGHVDLVYHMMRSAYGVPLGEIHDGPLTTAEMRRGAVRAVVGALYCPDTENGPGRSAAYLEALCGYAARYAAECAVIRTRGALGRCLSGHGPAGMLLLLENADALADMPPETLKRKGILAVGLTHAGKNRLGDGNAVASPGPLTAVGRRVVAAVSEAGRALDVAHLSDPCFRDVAAAFEGVLFSSHTGFRRFCDIPRNLSDDQVRVITGRGGVIGVSANPEMLRPDRTAGMGDVFRQLDWLVQCVGVDHAAVGSDFGGFDLMCAGLETIGCLQDLAAEMLRAGYPESAVRKVMGGNWAHFYGRIMDAEHPEKFPPPR